MKTGFKPTFTRVVQTIGFEFKDKGWQRQLDDLVHHIELQRSQYSPLMYVNMGVFVKHLLKPGPLKAPSAHLQVRPEIATDSRLSRLLEDPDIVDGDVAYETLLTDLVPLLEEFFAKVSTLDQVVEIAKIGNPNEMALIQRDLYWWVRADQQARRHPANYGLNGA